MKSYASWFSGPGGGTLFRFLFPVSRGSYRKQYFLIFRTTIEQPEDISSIRTPSAISQRLISHLTFSSARLDTARTAATIQKRSVIFDSGRPWNW